MKTTTLTLSVIFCALCSVALKGQDTTSNLLANAVDLRSAIVSVNPRPDSVAFKSEKGDVVINMEMIESFHRCYDKIVPFSLADFFKGNGNDISAKYMAFMKARMDKEPIDIAVKAELAKVQTSLTEMNNLSFTNLSYNEKPDLQIASNSGETKVDSTNSLPTSKTVQTTKRVNGVKWIVPNQK